jgi:uncharacterized protein
VNEHSNLRPIITAAIAKDSAVMTDALAALPIAKTDATQGAQDCLLVPAMANRHGLIAGATGTGKTVSLQAIVQQFSQIGVPVFVADIKGDLSGISQPGQPTSKAAARFQQLGLADVHYTACPVTFWDVLGEQGHPLRTTVSEMGPLLLARLLNLNDTQTGVLNIAFQVADDRGLLLLDFKDLRALVQHVGDQAKTLRTQYGSISTASVGAIQRALLSLEQQGGAKFFGEPALDLADLLRIDANGQGVVNVLAANKLMLSPTLYATVLLWLLSELFEQLPEVGDAAKPKLVLFFDEAHLLFEDAPEVLLDKVEQVVRLIRSKGVGVYFCTQNPMDVPAKVLGQLGNRVQHALRAFTPLDQKAVKAAAQTFRSNPQVDVETAIAELAVGEALISCLDPTGTPTPVERAWVIPTTSQIGAITPAQRQQILQNSPLAGRYDTPVDRQSAYELLQQRTTQSPNPPIPQSTPGNAEAKAEAKAQAAADRQQREQQKQWEREAAAQAKAAERAQLEQEKMMLNLAEGAAQMLGGTAGKKIARGVLGGILGYGTGRKR